MALGDSARRSAQEERWGGLLAAAQAGDARAYDSLLREVTPRLRQIARARIRDAAEVEDAVQDALMTIHALRHTYDPTRPFGPWMSTIASRRAIDRLRRRGRGAGRESNIDDLPESAASVAPVAEERIAARNLRDAVAELPESQRTALRLAKLEDLSLTEASARSGLSVGALKVATHRAMRSLRRRFGVGEGDDRADR
ncbi:MULTISPECIES: RNA polymerase sigma factor [Roseomonadaceae]|uniref:Sigma-70 family RNA polymerase sigma factor n=1 Tax=Falsiroseomonas oleicola TaxID=2801474 RepID=A0ABS6H6W5_9PROT|nr:sigma-70 family RNA polymerase sigma factor [Roseomonas oleicola]MBU8543236.1 sigma-70 family RNA polymerase sigma factor [Roseomonas oleicola]